MQLWTKNSLQLAKYAVLFVLSLINLYPVLWMVQNSFKTDKEIAFHPFSFPAKLIWANYSEAWKIAKLGIYVTNSVIVSFSAVVLTLAVGSLASYFISRFEFKWKSVVFIAFSFGMLIPIHATLVPIFIEMRSFGLLNTRLALLFPYVAFNLPLTVFILVGFMNTFPKEVEEAATADGCGVWRIYFYMILPMLRPALATTFILNFLNNWNEFSFALVLINDENLRTLPLGLANFAGQYTTHYGVQMAGLSMVLVPTLLAFVLVQKQVTQGMTAGAVKG